MSVAPRFNIQFLERNEALGYTIQVTIAAVRSLNNIAATRPYPPSTKPTAMVIIQIYTSQLHQKRQFVLARSQYLASHFHALSLLKGS